MVEILLLKMTKTSLCVIVFSDLPYIILFFLFGLVFLRVNILIISFEGLKFAMV